MTSAGRRWRTPLVAGVIAILFSPVALGSERFISMGGGPTSGVYFRVTQAICGFVNLSFASTQVRCSPESTPGSLYNIGALRMGDLDFAIVQSDLLDTRNARAAGHRNLDGSSPRSVMALYSELLTIVVPANSSIMTLDDLKGRRIFAGGQGSGSRATWDALERSMGWPATATAKVAAAFDASSNPLCEGQVEALISLSGHPAAGVRDQFAACRARFVSLDAKAIDAFLALQPNARKEVIPAAAYDVADDTTTIGVTAVLVTRADMSDAVAFTLVSSVLRNLGDFRAAHPALAGLSVQGMQEGLSAPLHPGAARAFRDHARPRQ